MSASNPNIVVDPVATNPAAYRIAYKATAEVFRVNAPDTATETKITDAVEAFSTAFPQEAWRFDGKGVVRSLKRLGQIIDDVYYSDILADAPLKAKLDAIVGLI
jgi:hypothetical protein